MATPVGNKQDFIDLFFNFFTERPRDLFRGLNNIFFGNKHLIGRETKAIGKGLKHFSRAADVFSFADLLGNLNSIRKHFNEKKIEKDLPMLAIDTANSVSESTAWLSTTGVISLSAYASSWVTSLSGATLMVSFLKRSIQSYSALMRLDIKASMDKKAILQLDLVKNISFFAIGVILFANGWFGFALNIAAITICSSAAIISSFASYYLEKKQEETNTFLAKDVALKAAKAAIA